LKKAKPLEISKQVVWEAWKQVKANKGAAGVDSETIADFERNLKDNLYKIWNRMSSGSYFPPPVRAVAIPKKTGGERVLGIPAVSDRIAQTVVKMYLEPLVEPKFHEDSYGYRPGKSAIQAIKVTRQRCWRYNWVLEFDIKGLFDNIDHELLMRAVGHHTQCKWILLYIERWLKAPFQKEDGRLVEREKGTPQGGVVSPVLSNLFLHYVFDKWMERNYPQKTRLKRTSYKRRLRLDLRNADWSFTRRRRRLSTAKMMTVGVIIPIQVLTFWVLPSGLEGLGTEGVNIS
jgi:RNA-directed DNA polymerase